MPAYPTGPYRFCWSASFSPDDTTLVTASNDRTAKIWNVNTGNCQHTLQGHTENVRSASFSPDGTILVTASNDRTAKIWNVHTGNCQHTLQGHTENVRSASFSPDGTIIVTASEDRTAKIWDVLDWQLPAYPTGPYEACYVS